MSRISRNVYTYFKKINAENAKKPGPNEFNEDVFQAQKIINFFIDLFAKSQDPLKSQKVKVDGMWGPKTDEALKELSTHPNLGLEKDFKSVEDLKWLNNYYKDNLHYWYAIDKEMSPEEYNVSKTNTTNFLTSSNGAKLIMGVVWYLCQNSAYGRYGLYASLVTLPGQIDPSTQSLASAPKVGLKIYSSDQSGDIGSIDFTKMMCQEDICTTTSPPNPFQLGITKLNEELKETNIDLPSNLLIASYPPNPSIPESPQIVNWLKQTQQI